MVVNYLLRRLADASANARFGGRQKDAYRLSAKIVTGNYRVKLDGQSQWKDYAAGQLIAVPANSGFDIEIKAGLCEYVCSFIG